MIKKTIIKVIPAALLVALSAFLLRGDVWTFWTWYLLAAVLGVVGMAVTGRLFRGFADKGWMFSKVVSITITGFLTWFLVSIKLLKFTTVTCVGITVVFGIVCILLYEKQRKAGYDCLPIDNLDLVYIEEILFFAVFLMWTYLAGFHPAAHGTEKFMDYGFMEAMMRSKTLPATDIWYSQGKINYYYGGQYFAVFLTKLSGTQVELTYNLMRTFVAAFAFVLPFSLVRQMTVDMQGKKSLRMEEETSVHHRIYCRTGSFHCRKHALCCLCTDHSADPEIKGAGSRQLLVPGCNPLYRIQPGCTGQDHP